MQGNKNSVVKIGMTHSNLKAIFPEIRLFLGMTIGEVKSNLAMRCGTPKQHMRAQLKSESGRIVAELSDDGQLLGYYSPQDGWTVHIIDLDRSSVSFQESLEDVSKVEKYMMPNATYEKLESTIQLKVLKKAHQSKKSTTCSEQKGNDFEVGSRCLISPGDMRGEIRFAGMVDDRQSDYRVGVMLDEPLGDNDGSHNGIYYFNCEANHGVFAQCPRVTQGDYPPIDLFDTDDSNPES